MVWWYSSGYHPLGPVQTSHFTGITDVLMGTSDDPGGFYHPMQSLPVLGCTQTMPFCKKVDVLLAVEFNLLKIS